MQRAFCDNSEPCNGLEEGDEERDNIDDNNNIYSAEDIMNAKEYPRHIGTYEKKGEKYRVKKMKE